MYHYTFQIYYDFSAYSEMAVGLALICGITLPWNFYSPLKASNMIEFWRNWHITLSNFFKDYVYIPLGGSRNGGLRKLFNLLIVFSISGIWHGVGLNFLIWGFLNGFFVSINHLFMKFIDLKKIIGSRFLSIFFTFTIVSFIFNFFRFENLKDLQNIFMRITFRGFSNEIYYVTESFKNYYILIILFFVTFFFPNVKDLLINSRENIKFKKFITNYNLSTTIIFSIILYLFIIRISKVEMQQFLYYQF